ncbi:hypothetical protein OIU83_07680 [Flavobacterium sp. LS1R49]|uniref:Protein required for attachment to host cells n=1 Tax=Flavobacterium shii TaxID=2987687 RepID=A0A9X2ZAJ1_9FLAO|nr:hypothetical protein [Flavobacterium shii]MCV9927526.1 hypothetical protein [Flavobacterium shii]
MKTIKQLGIYLDHAAANLIDLSNIDEESQTVLSDFDIQDKHETLQRSENEMHNKQQDKQREYFKKIAAIANNFNELILFGPTTAKTELLHFLQKDHNFDNVKIEVKNTDKLAGNQQLLFVQEYIKK